MEEARTATLTAVTGAAAAAEKSVQWSADELCRGGRPSLPDLQGPPSASPNAEINKALSALQVQAIASSGPAAQLGPSGGPDVPRR
ncbi:hypothetical protein ABZZ16_28295 [Streptomyces sp. NPDC006386]|uniref:hypothetical protein n=1 Tax=Streptomyces sp. NPDC006386 TaxID=3156762 RepID=UPI0033A06092